MTNNFYDNISCFSELELRRTIAGESKREFRKHCIQVSDEWYCFFTKTSTEWFDRGGNHVDVKDVTLTDIKDEIFEDNEDLNVIEIPPNVISISYEAFNGCIKLKSVTIPPSVKSIGYAAFAYCTALTSIVIPSSVTSISNSAFYSCGSLQSITIPNGVKCIDQDMFRYCAGLETVTIPSSVTMIGDSAFWGCTALQQFKTSKGNSQKLRMMLADSASNISKVKIIEEDGI